MSLLSNNHFCYNEFFMFDLKVKFLICDWPKKVFLILEMWWLIQNVFKKFFFLWWLIALLQNVFTIGCHAALLQVPSWLTQEFPPAVKAKVNRLWGGEWHGQAQKWWAVSFHPSPLPRILSPWSLLMCINILHYLEEKELKLGLSHYWTPDNLGWAEVWGKLVKVEVLRKL